MYILSSYNYFNFNTKYKQTKNWTKNVIYIKKLKKKQNKIKKKERKIKQKRKRPSACSVDLSIFFYLLYTYVYIDII